MALKSGDKWYCKVTHYENGRVVTRRIYSVAIQATDGRLYTLAEKKLPDSISLFTGESHSGEHMAEVLMNPKPRYRFWEFHDEWPSGRDLLHVTIGMATVLLAEIVFVTIRIILGA